MPFTLTHVAAGLPIAWICRWRVPFSALAVGCMINDLPVFFPGLVDYGATHSVRGVLTHCLPLGLLAYVVFHGLVKRPACALLPRGIASRLVPWIEAPLSLALRDLALLCVCIISGAATHVFWDSFTHDGRWGVRTFAWLDKIAIDNPQRPIRWFTLFQHGSSVAVLPPMLIGTLLWLRRMPPRPDVSPPRVPSSVRTLALGCLVVVPLLAGMYVRLRFSEAPLYSVIHVAVKLAGGILIALGLIYSVLYTALSRYSTVEPAQEV